MGSAIRNDFIKKSKMKEDFVEKERRDPFGGNGLLGGAKNYPLSKPMVYQANLMGDKGGTVGCVLTLFCWQRAQPST